MSKKGIAIAVASTTVLILSLWLATPFLVRLLFDDPAAQGQFGDLYGVINSLFSGMAFGAVFFALLLQYRQLRVQQSEIQENRKALQETVYVQAFKTVVDMLSSKEAVEARGVVLRRLSNMNYAEWVHEDKMAAEIVCRTYENVAAMITRHMIPIEYVVELHADSIARTWKVIEPLVLDQRVSRNWPPLWAGYERIARAARTSLVGKPA